MESGIAVSDLLGFGFLKVFLAPVLVKQAAMEEEHVEQRPQLLHTTPLEARASGRERTCHRNQ